ncbi:MAG: hypothetical protein NVSMB2_04680 [Chloroflexota bacterium]
MLFAAFRRVTRRHRRRGQGLVEYGAVAAALTLVGLLGLQAVTSAQVAYFDQLPTVSATPGAPGALLHVTSIDQPMCTPASSPAGSPIALIVGQTLQCTGMVVHDLYSPASDRQTPTGTLGLYVDTADFSTVPITKCALNLPTPESNACSAPLTWTPQAADVGPVHKVSVVFSCDPSAMRSAATPLPTCDNRATSNHFLASTTITVTVAAPVAFTPVCDEQNVEGWHFQVEFGHPMRCTVTATFGPSGPRAGNINVRWQVPDDSSAGAGTPLLSCAQIGDLSKIAAVLYTAGPCTPGSTTTCRTDDAGQCTIVYRLTRWLSGTDVIDPRNQGFTLSVVDENGILSRTTSFANLFKVVAPPGGHPTYSYMTCQSTDPNVTVDAPQPIRIGANGAQFMATKHITVKGTAGNVSCTGIVVDTSPGAALCLLSAGGGGYTVTKSGCPQNVDVYDAHAPIGQVHFDLGGTVSPNCQVDVISTFGPQAPNQNPYASSCSEALLLSVPSRGQGTSVSLTPVFNGASPNPTHNTSDVDHTSVVGVDFVP